MSCLVGLYNDFRRGCHIINKERADLRSRGEIIGGEFSTVSASICSRLIAPLGAIVGIGFGATSLAVVASGVHGPAHIFFWGYAITYLGMGMVCTRDVIKVGRSFRPKDVEL